MKKENNSLSYGPYLRSIRLAKDIQLKTVVRKTRIGMDYLIALEAENRDELPGEIFIKGFIRSYASAIGTDGDEAVRRFLLKCDEKHQPNELKRPRLFHGAKSWLRLTTFVGVLVGTIAFSVYAMNLSDSLYEGSQPWHHRLIKLLPFGGVKPPSQLSLYNGADNQATVIQFPQFTDPDNHCKKAVLKIIIRKKTWLRLMTDTIAPKHYKLNGGDRLELEVIPYMKLAIGCADNVQLLLNDKILDISGKAGHTLTFKTPL